MGRKKGAIWHEFTVVDIPQGGPRQNDSTDSTNSTSQKAEQYAICKHCKAQSAFPNATRMTAHLLDCLKCPAEVKARFCNSTTETSKKKRTADPDKDVDDPPESSDLGQDGKVHPVSGFTLKPKTQTSMTPFVDKTPPEKKRKIDELLARAMYTSTVPFSLFDNPYWQAALHELHPSYECPSTYEFSEPLLNAENSRVMTSVSDKLKSASSLGIILDGWSNIREEGIINFILLTPEPVFFKNVHPGLERESAEYIAKEIINVIEECQTKYNISAMTFFLLETDNAAAMKAAWVIVLKKFPHMVAIACSPHSLNLLLNDIMKLDSVKEIFTEAKSVIKTVKNHHIVSATFKVKQEAVKEGQRKEKAAETECSQSDCDSGNVTLKLPPKTRWAYAVISLYALLVNKRALKQTVICENLKDCIPKKVRLLVLDEDDDGFWAKVKFLHDFLVAVNKAIKMVQSNNATLSLIPEVSYTLRSELEKCYRQLSF